MNNRDQTQRFYILGGVLSILPLMVAVQILRIQLSPNWIRPILEALPGWPWEQHRVTTPRGLIFDRNGSLLAGNQIVYEVGIELQYERNAEFIAQMLSVLLDVDYMDVYAAASKEYVPGESVYVPIKQNVSQEQAEKLKSLIEQLEAEAEKSKSKNPPRLTGVVLYPRLARIYPEHTLASNVLGYVSLLGNGVFGVEEKYNDILAGQQKSVVNPLHPLMVEKREEVPKGVSLILTIDAVVQLEVERILDKALRESGAESGTIVVYVPKTGEILAMATIPRIDPNQYWEYEDIIKGKTPFNRAIGAIYEPGSVFKPLTMATAFEVGAVNLDTVFTDTGVFQYKGYTVYNWNRGAWGPQSMQGCLQHSLNVCLAWVAVQIGHANFYRYMQAFGIGRMTGVDLAGEMQGRLKMPGDGDWSEGELALNAFGQGVSVTPLQIAVAISALANEGKIMVPHIVRAVIGDGYQRYIEPTLAGVPISAQTARLMSELLARSLEKESSIALVSGYRVAGKTGTAEIPTLQGYSSYETNASFVGWVPVDEPRFLVYIWLEKPSASPWGSIVAAPVFREVVEKLVVLLNIPPDAIRNKLSP